MGNTRSPIVESSVSDTASAKVNDERRRCQPGSLATNYYNTTTSVKKTRINTKSAYLQQTTVFSLLDQIRPVFKSKLLQIVATEVVRARSILTRLTAHKR